MADILLKVGTRGPDPDWQDGDVLCAFNRRRIRCCHAQHICHPKDAGFTTDGLRPNVSVARRFREHTYRYRFERVSRTEVDRHDLVLLTVQRFDATPRLVDGVWQAIDVGRYVRRRLQHQHHAVFGLPGREVWYGGHKDFSNPRLDLVWQDIENMTRLREADHTSWPMGRLEVRHHVPIAVDDFDDATAAAYERPVLGPERLGQKPEILMRRRYRVNIDTVLSRSDQQAARDRNRTFDGRQRGELSRIATIVEKTP